MCYKWTQLKVRSSSYIESSVSLRWILFPIVNIAFPMTMTARWSHRDMISLYIVLLFILMKLVALSMQYYSQVLMSCSWNQCCGSVSPWFTSSTETSLRMKHIHISNFFLRSSSENRVTKTILLLVSNFV